MTCVVESFPPRLNKIQHNVHPTHITIESLRLEVKHRENKAVDAPVLFRQSSSPK